MADQIGVQIVAADQQFIAATKATASAMAAVVAQEEKLSKAARAAGLDQKQFSTTFKALEKQRLAETARAEKGKATAEKKAATDKARESKTAEAKAKKARKDEADASAKRKKLAAEESAAMFAAAGGVAAAVVAVGAAAGASLLLVGKLALETKAAKDNTLAMLTVLTNGRGDKTLKLLDGLAAQLGQKFQTVRDHFVDFRKAGLDNKQSAQLLKLVADLNTVDKSGSLAQQAIDRVLSYTANGTQTKEQVVAASKAMALLAKQAHVAGDGSVAAAAAVSTLTGALNRIDNTKTKVLESIGDRIQPSVNKAASAVADLVDGFLASKKGQAAIQLVSDSIIGLTDLVIASIPFFKDVGEAISIALDNPNVQDALAGLAPLLDGVVLGFKLVGAAVVGAGIAFGLAAVGLGAIVNAVGDAVAAVPKFVTDMTAAGGALIDGLIDGIKGAAGRLARTVTDLAGGIKKGFKDALGIKSPSKVFASYGINIGAGLNRGLDRSMPQGQDMARRMLPESTHMARAQSVFAAPAPIFAPAPAAQSSSAERPSITINIHDRATEEDGRRLEKVIDLWWSRKMQQQGLQ